MAFRQCFFFDTLEVTEIVLPKVLQNLKKAPNCTCWPSFFYDRMDVEKTLRGPFQFFRHCETFFIKKIFTKVSPFILSDGLQHNG